MCLRPLLCFAALQVFAADLAAQATTRVEFPRPAYEILLGQEFIAPVRINPLPPAGLFSYGLIVTVEGPGGLVGITTLSPQASLGFDGLNGVGNRGVVADAGRFASKGSADVFPSAKPNHTDPELGTIRVAGLPAGTYTLRLSTHNTLGPTESVFVDGQCRSLDERLAFGSAVLTVVAKPQGSITAVGPMKPDRQTGLLLQEYEIANTGSMTTAFRLLIRGMSAGSLVWNAHGTSDGVSYIDLPPLAPGATLRLTIEYRSQDRTTIPKPEFEFMAATPAAQSPDGLAAALQPRATLAGGHVLLEFNSVPGQAYYIQYARSPGLVWKTALPRVQGTGNRIQWIDNGLPRTESHPATEGSRFYRILVAEPASP
jgi:hypothetical protein